MVNEELKTGMMIAMNICGLPGSKKHPINGILPYSQTASVPPDKITLNCVDHYIFETKGEQTYRRYLQPQELSLLIEPSSPQCSLGTVPETVTLH